MSDERTCASCKHWDQETLRTNWKGALSITSRTKQGAQALTYDERDELAQRVSLRFGRCNAIREGWDVPPEEAETVRIVAWDGSEYRADVNTRDDFGCVLHAARGVEQETGQ